MLQHPVVKVLLQLALLAYPFYIWWAVSHWHPAAALAPLALLALAKAIFGQGPLSQRAFFLLSALLLLAASLLGKAEQAMLYYPVWMNSGMLLLFGWSLYYPPTVIERLARLIDGELDAKGVIVVLEATHSCMTIRGIRKPGSLTITSAVRGLMRSCESTRAEAMSLIQSRPSNLL